MCHDSNDIGDLERSRSVSSSDERPGAPGLLATHILHSETLDEIDQRIKERDEQEKKNKPR